MLMFFQEMRIQSHLMAIHTPSQAKGLYCMSMTSMTIDNLIMRRKICHVGELGQMKLQEITITSSRTMNSNLPSQSNSLEDLWTLYTCSKLG